MQAAAEHDPDVILMDVRMPEMDGLEATRRSPAASAGAPSLTVRERDILLRLVAGLPNAETAADLVISEAAVKSHAGNMLAKLGPRDRVQAVILAYETGIVRPGEPDAAARP